MTSAPRTQLPRSHPAPRRRGSTTSELVPISPGMDSLAIAVSGIRSAEVRITTSAHNVANSLTSSFRPLRVTQQSLEGGGSTAYATQASAPAEVNIAHELLDQMQASFQFKASARVFAAAAETRGSLMDLFG